MAELKCKLCRVSNDSDAIECFACGARLRKDDGSEARSPPQSGLDTTHASGPHPLIAVMYSVLVMCLTSYALFGMLAFWLASSRAPIVIIVILWISFLVAMATRRWRWVYSLALLPVPTLLIVGLFV